jgi:hypothetical protein
MYRVFVMDQSVPSLNELDLSCQSAIVNYISSNEVFPPSILSTPPYRNTYRH